MHLSIGDPRRTTSEMQHIIPLPGIPRSMEKPYWPPVPSLPETGAPLSRARAPEARGSRDAQERRAVQGVAPGPAPAPQGLLLARDALGAAALIAAAGFACWFLLTRLWEWLNGPQARGGGRVVRDRSMGGKAVFIPNQPLRRVEVCHSKA